MVWACAEKRERHYVGRRAMVMKVQERRKRGRPKRRCLDKVKDDIKEKGLSAQEVCDHATFCLLNLCTIKLQTSETEKV